jgi:hypothetical protein
MNDYPAGARLTRRRILTLLTAGAVAAGVAIGLALWPSGAVAGTIPGGVRVVTVTPVFGLDPNTGRHHLDHAFTITDPAKVDQIVALIDGLPRFNVADLSCARGNGAAMRLTFRTRAGGPAVATVLATYTGCPRVWLPGASTPLLQDYTRSRQQVQQRVLAIAGVRWPYTPDALPLPY